MKLRRGEKMMSAWVVVVVVLTVSMAVEVGIAQPSNDDTNANVQIIFYCDSIQATSPADFPGHLNSTFSQLRRKMSSNGVYYAIANDLGNSDAAYGLAQCRKYLTSAQCLACFDAAVSALQPCGTKIGGHVFLDNCYLRYENNYQYYAVPQGNTDMTSQFCGRESSSQPTTAFRKAVEKLLSDIRAATSRTSDFYTASTRQVTSGSNATVYAIGQCVENTSQAICMNCMDTAYNNLSSCLPFNEGRAVDVACFMRYSEVPFFQDNQTINLLPFLDKGSSSKSGLIVGVSVGASLLLFVLAFSLWYRRWKKLRSAEHDTTEIQGGSVYNYQDLKTATNDFSEECLLGKGGFGEVFKASLDGGVVVAVKKLRGAGFRERKEFVNEIKLISNVRHRNLLVQLGWCVHEPDLLLVLEYMPNGSLDKLLWGENRGNLNWKQRCDIILGIARGLAHLHDEFHIKIIHRDIKPGNILLDDYFQPKIADFGLAKYYPDDQTHLSTHFAGTMGYTPPEYVKHGHLSEKVDTYSFGIVALEVISGRRCSAEYYSGPQMAYLVDHAWKLYENGLHFKLIDESLNPKEYEEQDVMKIVEIALMCTQSPASLRPTMPEVVIMLSSGPIYGQRKMSRPTFIGADRRIYKPES